MNDIVKKVEKEEEIVLIRVYELAAEFEIDSKSVIEILTNAGEKVKSHLSSVDSQKARDIIQENI